MSKGERNRQKRRDAGRSTSSLEDHKRHKKVFIPPMLAAMGGAATPFNWKEHVPDMLWISSILEAHPGHWRLFDRALEPLDAMMPDDEGHIDGRLSSFERLPAEARDEARRHLANVFPSVLPEGLGHALHLLPVAPGRWMFEDRIEPDAVDADKARRFLREHLALLNDTRGVWATHARMIALGSYLRHGKLVFSSELEMPKLLSRYPSGLDEDQREQARSWVRATYNVLGQMDGASASTGREWAERFWKAVPKLARP